MAQTEINIKKERGEQGRLTLYLDGTLDTMTAQVLEKVLGEELQDVRELKLDCERLKYVTSAGLRILLSTSKQMNRQGAMTVANVNTAIMKVLHMTGFTEILTIVNDSENGKDGRAL